MGPRLFWTVVLGGALASAVGGCAPDLALSPEATTGGGGSGGTTSTPTTTGTGGSGGGGTDGGVALWASSITGSGDEIPRALGRQGSQLVLALEITGSLDLDGVSSAGATDVAWVRLTEGGTPVSAVRLGGTNPQRAHGLASDGSGFGLLAGDFSGSIGAGAKQANSNGGLDGYVAKLDSSGAALWIRNLGGEGSDTCAAVTVDSSGNVIVAGSFTGSLDAGTTSAGGEDAFVAKLLQNGTVSWIVPFGDAKSQRARAVAVDALGDIFVLADFDGVVELDGTQLTSAGETDIALLKLDGTGALLWAKSFGTAGADAAGRLVLDGGEVVFTGSLADDLDLGTGVVAGQAFVARLDEDGNTLQSRGLSSEQPFSLDAVAVDGQGNTVLAGAFSGALDVGPEVLQSAGGEDAFVVKLGASGSVHWSHSFGGPDAERATAVAITGSAIVVAGTFLGEITLGNDTLGPSQGEDFFLLALTP